MLTMFNHSSHQRFAVIRWTLLASLLVLLPPMAGGCAMRSSLDDVTAENAALQSQNFELRKKLVEAQVRIARAGVSQGGDDGAAVMASPGKAGEMAGTPGVEPNRLMVPESAGVVYSEPITEVPVVSAGEADGRAAGRNAIPEIPQGSAAAGELMKSARGRLDARDHLAALAAFREIVARFPGDALADDAQFGTGECFFQMGRFTEAIDQYRAVVDRFPYGDQVPFAFLKIGFAHLALEQRERAIDSFQTVSQAYPGTEAATVARQQIAHMKAQSP